MTENNELKSTKKIIDEMQENINKNIDKYTNINTNNNSENSGNIEMEKVSDNQDNDFIKKMRQDTDDYIKKHIQNNNISNPDINTPEENTDAPESEKVSKKFISSDEVTEYTANIWQYKPVPENEPSPYPEYISYQKNIFPFQVNASRTRGKKHKHEGTNCDDWFETAQYDKILCIAVSDGAGSKAFSRIGAKTACINATSSMINLLEKNFKGNPEILEKLFLSVDNPEFLGVCGILSGIIQQSVINACEAVENTFKSHCTIDEYPDFLKRELRLTDFSATLLTAIIIPIDEFTGECIVISCQIGDGMIAIINKEKNAVKLMGVPDSGDFAGETDFITSPKMKNLANLQNRTKISKSTVDSILIMTDGIADDYCPNQTEMLRLYFDLIANGIIKDNVPKNDMEDIICEFNGNIPEPVGYPSVKDKKVIYLNYVNRICSELGISLDFLSKYRSLLSIVNKKANELNQTDYGNNKLEVWLDNYVERGSFDDRTLVIVRFQEE
ncbi:MAG: protein phosphatase 2C domain-containing protein [Oscillospiraceae bacterium]|nr:protein phosphatase 2C domain-containing protein [Oscillospiraceae bacterium]